MTEQRRSLERDEVVGIALIGARHDEDSMVLSEIVTWQSGHSGGDRWR